MQIGTAFHDAAFTPAPPAATQVRQDNAQRERVPPADQADAFAGSDPRREQAGSPGEIELYDARGRKTGDTADDRDNTATGATADAGAGEGETTETGGEPARPTKPSGEEMSAEEVERLQELQRRDREVRIHEQQHAAVGGQYAGAPSYDYQTGPDGKQYAVGGEVQIDISPIPGDPRATIDKMQQVKAAALAPTEPSQADKAAAARADQHIREAQAKLLNPQGDEAARAGPGQTATGDGSTRPGQTATGDGNTRPGQAAEAGLATDTAGPAVASPRISLKQQVIAGVYGQAAQANARNLLGLA